MISSTSPARSPLRLKSFVPLTLEAEIRLTVSSFFKVSWLRGMDCAMALSSIDPLHTRTISAAHRGSSEAEANFGTVVGKGAPLKRRVFLAPMQLQSDFVGTILLAAALGD